MESDNAFLAAVFLFLQSIILLLLGIALKKMSDVLEGQAKTDKKVGEIQVWAEQHEKKDDERIALLREGMRDMWSAINNVRGGRHNREEEDGE
jgi:hypothetical protein